MSSRYPSKEDCYEIMLQEGLSPKVMRHVCVVNQIAMVIAKRCDADLELVNAASLLHDIGRSRTHGIAHVAESVNIARKRNLPEELVLCIGRHIASGFTDEEAAALGLPPGDYMPVTLEDKIVNFSDNLVNDRQINFVQDAIDDMLAKGYETSARRMMQMNIELTALCGEEIDSLLREARIPDRVEKNCSKVAE